MILMFAPLLALALAQPPPQEQPKRIEFKFKEVSVEVFLNYVSRVTGFAVVDKTRLTGTITAFSEADVPADKVVDFINSVFKSKGAVAVKTGPQELTIVPTKESEGDVTVGIDPNKIEPGDKIVTAVVPLLEVRPDPALIQSLQLPPAKIFADPSTSSLVIVAPASDARRLVRILQILDSTEMVRPFVKILKLRNIRSDDAARALAGLMGLKPQVPGQPPIGGPAELSVWVKPFAPEPPSLERKVQSRSPIADSVRLLADTAGNHLVLIGTEANAKIVEEWVARFDVPPTPDSAPVTKAYSLKFAAAQALSTLIVGIFGTAAPITPVVPGQPGQVAGLNPRIMTWIQEELKGELTIGPVKAVADPVLNTLLVVATQDQIEYVDRLVALLDREPEIVVHQLRFADATQAADMLTKGLTGPTGPQVRVAADVRANAIVVTGTTFQQKMVAKFVIEIDRQAAQSMKIKVFPLLHVKAEKLAPVLKGLFEDKDKTLVGAQKNLAVLPHGETNAIVVQGSETQFAVIEELLPQLDHPPAEAELIDVISVHNTSVKEIATTLQDMIPVGTFSAGAPAPISTPAPTPAAPASAAGTQPAGQVPPQARAPEAAAAQQRGAEPTGPTLKIKPVPERNALVVRGTGAAISTLRSVIEKLDKFAPQVLIRSIIAEVTLDDQTQFGVEGFWETAANIAGVSAIEHVGTSLAPSGLGFTYTLTGNGLEGKLLAFASSGRLDVLATPRILALNATKAMVNFGKSIPIITGTDITTTGIVNSVGRQDVGIILKVEPRINPDGLVTIPLSVEVSDVNLAESVPISSSVSSPTFTKNVAETVVTVRSGRTAVLGGLIRDSDQELAVKVPILGDIPLLKYLFSATTHTKQKHELMIFLTPIVAFTQEDLERLTADEKGEIKAIDLSKLPHERSRWTGAIRD